jgi:hypothetical protein
MNLQQSPMNNDSSEKSRLMVKIMNSPTASVRSVVVALTLALPFVAGASGTGKEETQSAILKTDRWMEIDLYWFDKANKEASVEAFWERNHSIYQNCEGWKGLIINAGWLLGVVTDWSGDLNQQIVLPKEMQIRPYYKDYGYLLGSTIERQELQKQRFEVADKQVPVNYEAWTYRDLKELAGMLRRVARERYQISDFKVGTFVLDWRSVYGGEELAFGKRHPEIWSAYSFSALLSDDKTHYGAYPGGIVKGTPMSEFFGKQWGDMSKKVGLDAIVLRDGCLGWDIYPRLETKELTEKVKRERDEKAADQGKAAADLVRITKESNPKALVMWYSDYVNGSSAVATWRIRNIDLESIAKAGYLDAWIDQSWAAAWNEVAVREYPCFWNNPYLGYTPWLAYILGHAAIFSESKVHHYFLAETVDAWETQDVIHSAPSRLKWCYWAFTHAAVKTPSGLKMPDGAYISWAHKKKALLSEEDIRFVVKNLNEAVQDAQETADVRGPTLIYCRSALEWQQKNKPNETMGEWIEDQAANLMKWSVPILSIARIENLDAITTDLPIFQTPNHLSDAEKTSVLKYLKSGKPAMVVGDPVNGIDPEIETLIGIQTASKRLDELSYIGTINYKVDGIYKDLPDTFPIYQPYSKNTSNGADEIYCVNGYSPCLTYTSSNGKRVIYWDAPEMSLSAPGGMAASGDSLDQILGSPVPFALTARLLNQAARESGLMPWMERIALSGPVATHFWTRKDGKTRILLGNLEEGINHTNDQTRSVTINLPESMSPGDLISYEDFWSGAVQIGHARQLPVTLGPAQVQLLSFKSVLPKPGVPSFSEESDKSTTGK